MKGGLSHGRRQNLINAKKGDRKNSLEESTANIRGHYSWNLSSSVVGDLWVRRTRTLQVTDSPAVCIFRRQRHSTYTQTAACDFHPELTDQIGQMIHTTSAPCVCPPLFVMFESEHPGNVTI
jgi:hypothetical protein